MTFVKGHKLAKGRPLGSVNIYTKSIKETVLEAFAAMQEDPEANILSWGMKNPTEFYKIAARLIPTQIQANIKLDNGIPLDRWLESNDTNDKGSEPV